MKFTLEKISAEDKCRILADVRLDDRLRISFAKLGDVYWMEEPAWAIDCWRKSYFIRAPQLFFYGTLHVYYYLFSNGTWYRLYRRGPFSNQVAIEGQARIPPKLLGRLKDEVTAAFAVFGDSGDGPTIGTTGIPMVPVFVDEDRRAAN